MAIIERDPREVELWLGDDSEAAAATSDNGQVEDVTVSSSALKPVDDRGGPTSFYQGEVGEIAQLAIVFENLINGRDANDGLANVRDCDLLVPRPDVP